MWWQFFILFVAIAAVSVNEFEDDSPSCNSLIDLECTTGVEKLEFPGNIEELQTFCKFSLDYFNCTEQVLNLCDGNSDDFSQHLGEYSDNVKFYCSQSRLYLHNFVKHLPCLKKNCFTIAYCHPSLRMDMDSFAAGLRDLGMLWDDPSCVDKLYYLGCVVAGAAELCGDGTRVFASDIMNGFRSLFEGCPTYARHFLLQIGMMMQTEARRKLNLSEPPQRSINRSLYKDTQN